MKAVLWILIVCLPWSAFAQDSAPETPRPQSLVIQVPPSLNPEPPQPQSQRVWDKKFIFLNVALGASIVFDNEVTARGVTHHKCVEAHGSSSRESLYAKNFGYAAAFTGVAYLLKRKHVHFAPFVPGSIITFKHLHGGIQWFTEGCF